MTTPPNPSAPPPPPEPPAGQDYAPQPPQYSAPAEPSGYSGHTPQPGQQQFGYGQQHQYPGQPYPYPGAPTASAPSAAGTLKTLTVVSMVIVAVLALIIIIMAAIATTGWSGALLDAVGGSGTGAGMMAIVILVSVVALGCYIAVLVGLNKRAAWGRVLGIISCCIGLVLIGGFTLMILIAGIGEGAGAFLGMLIFVAIFFLPFLLVNAFWLKAAFNKELIAYFQ